MSPRVPPPPSILKRHPLTAGAAVTFAALTVLCGSFTERLQASGTPTQAIASPKTPSPRARNPKPCPTPEEPDLGVDDSETASTSPSDTSGRIQSYADTTLETLALLQECAPQMGWTCELTDAAFSRPSFNYETYLLAQRGQPFQKNQVPARTIGCTLSLSADDSFETYIAVSPWDTDIQVSHDFDQIAYLTSSFPTLPNTDPCGILDEYRNELFDQAETSLDQAMDVLEEKGFEEGEEDEEEAPYCFFQTEAPAAPCANDEVEAVEVVDQINDSGEVEDSAALDTGAEAVEPLPPCEPPETIYVCLSPNGLWVESGWLSEEGTPEEVERSPVSYPSELGTVLDGTLDEFFETTDSGEY